MKKRFRSINEFIPHAIWLMGDPSADCECKYCAKKAQREITASLSNILRTTPTSSPGPGPVRTKTVRDKGKGRDPNRIKEARQRDTRVYASVQKPVQILGPSPNVMKQPMLVERTGDIRGMFSKAAQRVPRWFREGEIVWCALNPPIRGTDNGVSLEYWPAIIEEISLKSVSVPRNSANQSSNADSTSGTPQPSTSAIPPDLGVNASEKGPMLNPTDEPLPWKIFQYHRYKVQMLAISHTLTFDNADVLPYQVYMPPNEVIQLLSDFPAEKLDFDKVSLSKFNPAPASGHVSIQEAIPPYAVALQIASALSSYWCLTDEYELKFQLPPTPIPNVQTPPPPMSISSYQPSIPQFPPPQNLQQVIEAASRHNAQVSKATNGYYESVSTVHPEASASVRRTATNILGVPPPPEQMSRTQFQGLWWGSERIWTDDFIRLKFPRRTLAPNGGNHILPPAGLGESALAAWHNSERDTAELGAGMRGVFLKIDGIMAVDVPTGNGTQKEARVCGRLFELADEDWIDPDEALVPNGSLDKLSSPPKPPSAGPSQSISQNGTKTQVIEKNTPTSGPPMAMDLPLAPEGYKFRPILEPGFEFVGAMGLISGRYYPRVLRHPRVLPSVKRALDRSTNLGETSNLWALEGLSGGYFNSVDPIRYKKSRTIMLLDADKEAISELQTYKQARLLAEQNPVGEVLHNGVGVSDGMDVDDIY